MAIKVYNTLDRKKEEFTTRNPGKVSMYVCGPTVYNYIHIGNARTYLSFDMLYRYLRYRGYDVTYIRNLTDVDDKIINRAKEENTSPEEIAERYTREFWEDAKNMGLAEPTAQPKATGHIKEMIDIIEALVEKGLAYVIDGDVYFEITKFDEYGKLAHRALDEMRAGERVEIDPRKHHPMDFALWKAAKPGEPAWDSPWGKGRPGWHIECTAMSLRYLGIDFDVHGGGRDLIFPHHENEIAQTEGYTGRRFAKYWLHGGMVNIGEEKMAKSLGNIVLVRDLLKDYNANVLRLLALGTHYRSPIDFSPEKLKEAEAAYERFLNVRRRMEHVFEAPTVTRLPEKLEEMDRLKGAIKEVKEKFIESMDDDFNSAAALAALFEFVKEINTFIEAYGEQVTMHAKDLLEEADAMLLELSGAVGLNLALPKAEDIVKMLPEDIYQLASEVLERSVDGERKDQLLDEILERRNRARKEKDWGLADKIRERLTSMGIEIEDTPLGPRWKLKT
ncbi:MAG TPA: cysteine--tRNA ligase [Anaerolineae bacterium]|nr:cysteine--tRNA ligase [Anaerolineae bacterium]